MFILRPWRIAAAAAVSATLEALTAAATTRDTTTATPNNTPNDTDDDDTTDYNDTNNRPSITPLEGKGRFLYAKITYLHHTTSMQLSQLEKAF